MLDIIEEFLNDKGFFSQQTSSPFNDFVVVASPPPFHFIASPLPPLPWTLLSLPCLSSSPGLSSPFLASPPVSQSSSSSRLSLHAARRKHSSEGEARATGQADTVILHDVDFNPQIDRQVEEDVEEESGGDKESEEEEEEKEEEEEEEEEEELKITPRRRKTAVTGSDRRSR
eukprot:749176-Hanusia_phi.AAC.6